MALSKTAIALASFAEQTQDRPTPTAAITDIERPRSTRYDAYLLDGTRADGRAVGDDADRGWAQRNDDGLDI
ncbi:MAG: hypothetical protein PVI86_10960 [Phycisphaerae bacterium]